jgi:lon-related putative ATP-dependent protease
VRLCDPAAFGVEDTAAVEGLGLPMGQPRALAALEFGTEIEGLGFNVFVMGATGTGRSSVAHLVLGEAARQQPAPPDWCYLHNFDDPQRPRALSLPPGRGVSLRRDVEDLIKNLDQAIVSVFESDQYQERRDEVLKQYHEERHQELQAFEREAEEAGFTVGRGPAGLIVAPTKEGEVITPQEYAALPEEQRDGLEKKREELQERLLDILRRGQRTEKEARDAVRQLDREMVQFACAHLVEDLIERYRELPEVVTHLQAIMTDLVENVAHFRDGEERPLPLPPPLGVMMQERSPYDRYRINLLVEHSEGAGAPVVEEANPTLHNLTGEVEYQTQMGALVTDFTMIKAGALHRANGGFLVLDALTLLRRPYAWDAITRCLKSEEIRIESLGDQFRLVSTVSLEPEPIPLQVKVVLIGTPMLYYLLYQYDEDFRKLFKVKADFGSDTDRDAESERLYLAFVAQTCREKSLPAFSAGAVARVIEHGSRLAEDQSKLTTRLMDITELLQEAAYWARKRESERVEAEDVTRAIEQHIWRSNRMEQRILEMIHKDVLKLDTSGAAVGQVNGIALIPLGDFTIGRPTRITARTYLGRAGVINIEREVKMSGPIHDKGVLIISGYLGQKYALDRPLSCAISIVFEQSYEEIEGDSASAAELFALLSSLAQLPLRQDIAVTGSVNQHGIIQPVGGVTRKVEGFWEVCKTKGLTGTQGVLLPASNREHLMLCSELVGAAREGQFRVYTMETLDEGLELLTGLPAGEPDAAGQYPEGTVHGAVQRRLAQFADNLKAFMAPEDGGEKKED